jgi:DNA-binding GntR family transcriptional regulator
LTSEQRPRGAGPQVRLGHPVQLDRRALTDQVYEAVKALVMDHAIAPGSRVNIDALARDLDVSQTPLREALARLEADGLVSKEPMRGYTTTELLGRKELDDLYALRLLIEPPAAAAAAASITVAGKVALCHELATCADAPSSGDYTDYASLTMHDYRFHDLIAELGGNAAIRTAFNRTHSHLHLFRLYYGSGLGMQALQEHRQIQLAICAGDPAAAAEAMRSHLDSARRRFAPVFDASA